MAVAMGEVQDAVADAERAAIRAHVAQPDDQVRERPVGGNVERDDGGTEKFEPAGKRCRIEYQRERVVVALVAGLIRAPAERAPGTAALSKRAWRWNN